MPKNSVDLIFDVGEKISVFESNDGLDSLLQSVVDIVAKHMGSEVCSIYIYDAFHQSVVMAATHGLSLDAVGQVSLSLDEGVTGRALKELRPVKESSRTKNRVFKHVDGVDEDRFKAILAVPILRGLNRVGVLVIQDEDPDHFDDTDVQALRTIAAQLARVIDDTRALLNLRKPSEAPIPEPAEHEDLRFLKGKSVAGGVAVGRVEIVASSEFDVLTAPADEDEDQDNTGSVEVFDRALIETRAQLTELQKHLDEKMADVASFIFGAHLLILQDHAFVGAMRDLVKKGYSPQRAVTNVVNDFIHIFSQHKNPRIAEKVQDVKDLGHRLMQNIQQRDEAHTGDYQGQIIIAEELMPSDFVKLATQKVEGVIILSGGGSTAHISILARSLEVPLIFLDNYRLLELPDGIQILMDAHQGTIFVEPDQMVLANYETLLTANKDLNAIGETVDPETHTSDGERVLLYSNINLLSDVKVATTLKAEGVGLYRSEFPFIVRNDFPSEEEQYRIYKRIVAGMGDREVILRTLDVGGDKMLTYSSHTHEANPFLGLRAIRFTLLNPQIFSQQLRAMLRAGEETTVNIMFPFISSVDEFEEAKAFLEDCLAELIKEGVPCCTAPKIGCMIELPAAVEVVDELADIADFLCIGSNDLIQYLLAVDRTNERVSHLYVGHHPAVLRALKRIADVKDRVDVSVCGDIAADPNLIPFLLGIGIRKLSVDPRSIPEVQKIVQQTSLSEAKKTAETLLSLGRLKDVEAFLNL
jgi:phosphotransferase system, enzyme I, PtsP